MLAIMVLAAASGFPNQITESALQAWLKDAGATNTTIGVMSYVALPYLFKFLWAPFIDRYPLPVLGRRRGWILAMQIAIAIAIALLALQNPGLSLIPVTVCAVAIVFFSATQDIAFDAYRTDVSSASERGPAAAATNLGYRTFSWLASAVALIGGGSPPLGVSTSADGHMLPDRPLARNGPAVLLPAPAEVAPSMRRAAISFSSSMMTALPIASGWPPCFPR